MNWLKQTADKPLYTDILWSRPENKRTAGKLLIIGGHQQSFNAVSDAYAAAEKAGAGTVRVMLPDKLQKMLSRVFPEAEFASSTPIGSFSRDALAALLEAAQWADSVLLGGDFGKNSETAILLESFVEKFPGKLALSGDAVDYFLTQAQKIINRDNTLVIANLSQLQKLAIPTLVQQNADFIKVIEQLSGWAGSIKASIVTVHSQKAIVASRDKLSSTPTNLEQPDETLAACAATWWMQQPSKGFEAVTTAIYQLISGV